LQQKYNANGVSFTRVVYLTDDAREKLDNAIAMFTLAGAKFTQGDVTMQENGRSETVRVITFTDKPQVEEVKTGGDRGGHGGGRGGRGGGRGGINPPNHPPRVPIESLPVFVYNKATDRNVGRDST
jgi:hypothetical protein